LASDAGSARQVSSFVAGLVVKKAVEFAMIAPDIGGEPRACGSSERGEMVTVSGPDGNFVLRRDATQPSLFIVCDGGFASVKSMIEHAISMDRIEADHLYRFRNPGAPGYYHNLCRAWRDALDNFTYSPLQILDGPPWGLSPIVDDIPDLGRFDAYVAGPGAFAEAARELLLEQGLDADRLSVGVISD